MTKREFVVVSAFSGILLCEYEDWRAYVEEVFGRKFYAHEMATDEFWEELKQKSEKELKKICEETNEQS